MIETTSYETTSLGQEIGPLVKTPTQITLFLFGVAMWTSHRIHYDRDHALSEGYRDVLVTAPLMVAYIEQMLVPLRRRSWGRSQDRRPQPRPDAPRRAADGEGPRPRALDRKRGRYAPLRRVDREGRRLHPRCRRGGSLPPPRRRPAGGGRGGGHADPLRPRDGGVGPRWSRSGQVKRRERPAVGRRVDTGASRRIIGDVAGGSA